jgi:hypothetical protein
MTWTQGLTLVNPTTARKERELARVEIMKLILKGERK